MLCASYLGFTHLGSTIPLPSPIKNCSQFLEVSTSALRVWHAGTVSNGKHRCREFIPCLPPSSLSQASKPSYPLHPLPFPSRLLIYPIIQSKMSQTKLIMIDDTDSGISYTGNWIADKGSVDNLGNYGAPYESTNHYTTGTGSFTYTFSGESPSEIS